MEEPWMVAEEVFYRIVCSLILILFFEHLAPWIWFTHDVSYVKDSRTYSATFLIQTHHFFIYLAIMFFQNLRLKMYGFIPTVVLFILVLAWKQQKSMQVNRDRRITDCKDCYKKYIIDSRFEMKFMGVSVALFLGVIFLFSDFFLETADTKLEIANHFVCSRQALLGFVLFIFTSTFMLIISFSPQRPRVDTPDSVYSPVPSPSPWYHYVINVKTMEISCNVHPLIYVVDRLKECSHGSSHGNRVPNLVSLS